MSGKAGRTLQAAVAAHRQGKFAEAVTGYDAVLAAVPEHPDALHLKGLALHQQGRHPEAVGYVEKAAEISPRREAILFDAGRVLAAAGEHDRAVVRFKQVLGLNRGRGDAYHGLASSYRALGDLAAAAAACAEATRLDPRSFAAHLNRGLALRECGRPADAVACFERAVELDPGFVDGYLVLGQTLAGLGHEPEAIAALRTAARLDPERAEVWYELGNALRSGEFVKESIACFRRALELRPGHTQAAGNLGEALQVAGMLHEAIRVYEGLLEREPRCRPVISNLLLALNYPGNLPAVRLAEEHRRRGADFARGVTAIGRSAVPRAAGRTRIGYVSPDLREHSVAWFFEPILANHDPARFEIFCYAAVARPDTRTERLRGLAGHWRDIEGVSDDEVARMVVEDRIDILVDLAGHTWGNRLGVFVLRPAPVQVTYLGYPNTTGLEAIDYRLTDDWADPPGSEKLCTEKLIRLPEGFLCYGPDPRAPEIEACPRRRDETVFGSFNNVAKLSELTVDLWAEVLKQTTPSRLLLKARLTGDPLVRGTLLKRFGARGIGPERLELVPPVPSPVDHLAFYNRIDIALDPSPYNGTTTTCEALWMGVPVVTLAGDRHASRVGAGLLARIGMEELVADSPERYVELAVTLARKGKDRRFGPALRKKMAESNLCDGRRFTRRLEGAYGAMMSDELGE